jgi:hypothetical protein
LVLQSTVRCFASDSDDKPKAEKTKWNSPLDLLAAKKEPDNLIPTSRERKLPEEIAELPDFVTEDVKKDLEELGLDSLED